MRLSPTFDEFARGLAAGRAQLVWTKLIADLETPVSAFLKVANGEPMSFPRWVLVNQSVHHATEHRAQIVGALAANGITGVDLDAIDVWSLSDEDSASR